MSQINLLAGAVLILGGFGAIAAQDGGERNGKPAWPDGVIDLGMYSVRYEKPVVGDGEKPAVYQQKATHTWSGGRYEVIHITLARDPAFKDKYSADAMKKEENPPKELEINKKRALHWKFKSVKPKLTDVTNRLVVLLADDKAIIIEQIGGGQSLEEAAKRFDFAKVEKALANPPAK